MKIVHLVTQMEGGGAQRCAVEVARYFRKWDMDCEVWFMFKRKEFSEGEPFVRSIYPREPQSKFDYIRILIALFIFLVKNRPDALICHSHYANVVGCFFALLLCIPKRVACQTGLATRAPLIAQRLDYLWGVLGVYSRVIMNSKTNYENYKLRRSDRYMSKVKIVCNGVLPLPVIENVSREGNAICAIGRLSPSKNYECLITAMEEMTDYRLYIAGEGADRVRLEQLIAEKNMGKRVFLLGNLTTQKLATLCYKTDLFVHPSFFESFGLVSLEAASTGLPLIVSDLKAHHEILGEEAEGNAVFFNPNDPAELTQKIQNVLHQSALRKQLSERSLKLAKKYSLEDMAKGYLNVLRC